eukprot:c21837_g1_i1 orf=587-1408(-)
MDAHALEQGLSFQIGEPDCLVSLLELSDLALPPTCFDGCLEGFTALEDHGGPFVFFSDREVCRHHGNLPAQERAVGVGIVEDSPKSKTQASSQLKCRRNKKSLAAQQSSKRTLKCEVVRPKIDHFLSERYRRKTMSEQLEILHSLIPQPLAKDRFSTLSAAEDYIRSLQNEIQELRMRKSTLTSSLVENRERYNDADKDSRDVVRSPRSIIEVFSLGQQLFITLTYSSELRPSSEILLMLEAYGLDVLNVNISLHNNKAFHTIRALQVTLQDA